MNSRIFSGTGLAIAIGLFLAVNIVTNASLTNWRLDLTQSRLYTLSDGTRNILASIEEPVSLRLYYSARAFAGIPELQSHGARVREMLEEYAVQSNGGVELTVIDPEAFSEAEDQAVAAGIRQIPVNASGDVGYIGLVGTNTTDDEEVIEFFPPGEEESLEYDLTKLVYNLANPRKRAIGIISSLPVMGQPGNPLMGVRPRQAWAIVELLREAYDVRDLGRNVETIDPQEIDTLVVVHPKNLTRATQYAIDQFVLKGGKAMVLVDPLSEEDQTMPDPETPMIMPDRGSDLPDILKAWGLRMVEGKVAGDFDAAIRVSYTGGRGPQQVEYLPWLRLEPGNLNQDDFVTRGLKVVNVGAAGILEKLEGAATEFTPLIETGLHAADLEREGLFLVRDPSALLDNFEPLNRKLVLAARIRGPAVTAFPDGRPKDDEKEKRAPGDPGFVKASSGPINVIVIADTDIIADRFWVQVQDVLGMRVPRPVADNADLFVNALDNLGGNDDLINLRSRGESLRPFERVVALQREAEAQFREKERELVEKLAETEQKIAELQREGTASAALLTAEQKQEIDAFRAEQLRIRKELRAVQHDLQKNIDNLGAGLKFINIWLVPLLIGLSVLVGWTARAFGSRPRTAG